MAEVESMPTLNRHSTVVLSWLLMLMRRSSYTAQLDKIHNLVRHQKWSEPLVFLTCWLQNVLRATTACTFSRSELPKVVRTPSVFNSLTSKCASRHNGVHFFEIWTSKSSPRMVCFVHFDLEMCFAPQRRALFRDLNFQKCSDHGVFCAFWLPNVLRATTACTFSRSELPKVVREWCVLCILTWKCASRHNGVRFFDISTAKSAPTMVCFVHFDFQMCFAPQRRALFRHLNCQKWSGAGVFCTFWLRNVLRATTACNFSSFIWPAGSAPAALASLLFDPPEPQIIGKTQCFATFLPFPASASSFFLYSFSSTLLSSNLSLLSASSLLCFSSVHIVGSVTSKLPSILNINKHLNNALKCKNDKGCNKGKMTCIIMHQMKPLALMPAIGFPAIWCQLSFCCRSTACWCFGFAGRAVCSQWLFFLPQDRKKNVSHRLSVYTVLIDCGPL